MANRACRCALSRKRGLQRGPVADQPRDTPRLPCDAPDAGSTPGSGDNLLLGRFLRGALRRKLDDPIGEASPFRRWQPVGISEDADLSHPSRGARRPIHGGYVIIVELGIAPRRHGDFRQSIDRASDLPIDQRDSLPPCETTF